MSKIFFSITVLAISFVTFAQTPTNANLRATKIVNGLFFDQLVPTPEGSSMVMLRDPEGKTVMAIYPPQEYIFSTDVADKAIPYDKVMYAKELLKDYEGHRPLSPAECLKFNLEVGEPFIQFNYKDTDNQVWNNQVLKGKVYVINIWQKECGPCRREMPVLSTWKERYPDVIFLSASRHDANEIMPIVKQHGFTWNHLQEADDIVFFGRKSGYPVTIVVDKNGIVQLAVVGASEKNQTATLAIIEKLAK